ncbi:beta-ketoacyl-acyl-carrier-protein synthase II [Ehrlichia chaffeensis str. Heartland]|uniref:3-oxoacyl-[acyl-carrier-protein] synthase 2 n=1 Tax=Ehrlichia chaffeensis (strain ATCC CRL-10679 / Arkansas) TaxID=205920 RepID=Q2GFV6_EHRCR|nr:beta-ketoacyl-ACP synthase II [Ehrlichia chaffeensis]ABD45125.1 3-oxoacyl-(acyl-carrier-protein) synthase II [Ehrlichia chaffeensis str. Arkansas]AHX03924.1 beta-ketoacyl-acyl-carrier-protein synthase II [Ehrlichia chaffeensis str. Heartland]AHX10116.1 beta-ketoacyl-acyl-carrier-protein synthase II [Ehrlichia chaffeensis str. West Paces]
MAKKRVVITGLGLVTSLGSDLKTVWDSLSKGISGIRKIDRFDTSDLDCKVAGQVTTKPESEEYIFDAGDYIPEKDLKKMDTFIHFGIASATQAINDSNLLDYKDLDYSRVGVIVGSGIGGLQFIEKTVICLKERGPKRISPFFIPASLINLTSGHISMKYGFTGLNDAVVTACSTGAQAIGNAARVIQSGEADVIIAGGTESAICRIGIAGFAAMKALSTKFNDTPELASRPWDKQRDGFVMGEGSGVVILEDYEHAKKRGARIYGELLGYGMTSDAYHMSAPHPEGKGGIKSIELALSNAQLNPESINYINAHGTSTPIGDSIEIQAIKNVFKESVYKVPISSTKSSIGHLLGAAGSVEAIFCILAMNTGIAPPTLNLHESSEDPKLNLVPLNAQEHKINYCLSNSFGFGGVNVSLVFGKV